MGDFDDMYGAGKCGLDGIPYGIDSPDWADEPPIMTRHEFEKLPDELRIFKTKESWRRYGRVIKDGEEGTQAYVYSIFHDGNGIVFSLSQTVICPDAMKQKTENIFATHDEAAEYVTQHHPDKNATDVVLLSQDGDYYLA